MKLSYVIFLLLTTTTKLLSLTTDCRAIEVYITSLDCTRCTTKLNELIKHSSDYNIQDITIYVDSKVMKVKLLEQFSENIKDNIIVDKDIVNNYCNDGYSRLKVFKDDGYKIKLLREYNKDDIAYQTEINKIDTIFNYKDDLISGSNPKFSTFGDNMLVYNSILNYFIFVSNLTVKPVFYKFNYSLTDSSYAHYLDEVKLKQSIDNLLPYDEAVILNNLYKLPLFNISSFNLNENELTLFENVYFYYYDESSGDTINRGFVFYTTINLDTSNYTFNLKETELILPFDYDNNKFGQNIFTQSFRVSDSTHFAFVRCYSDDEVNKRIDNRLLGIVYLNDEGSYRIKSKIRTKEISYDDNMTDDIINVMAKHIYSNTNEIITLNSNHIVLNYYLNTAIDISNGKVFNLNDFISQLTGIPKEEFSYFHYINMRRNVFTIVYNNKENDKEILELNFNNKEVSKRHIKKTYGTQVGSFISKNNLFIVKISLDGESLEVSRYRLSN